MDDQLLYLHPDNIATFALENIRKYQKIQNYSFLRSILSLCVDNEIRHTIGRWAVHVVKKPNKAFGVILKEEVQSESDVSVLLRTDSPASRFISCIADSHRNDFDNFFDLLHTKTKGFKGSTAWDRTMGPADLTKDTKSHYLLVEALLNSTMPYWLCSLCRYGYLVVKGIMKKEEGMNLRHLVVRSIAILRILNPLIIEKGNSSNTSMLIAKSLMMLGHVKSELDPDGTKLFNEFCNRILTRSVSFSSPRDQVSPNAFVFTSACSHNDAYLREFLEIRNFIWHHKNTLIHKMTNDGVHLPLDLLMSVLGIFNNSILSFQFFNKITVKPKSRRASKLKVQIDLSDLSKWSSIFTSTQLGYLEHSYVAGVHNPLLSECATLLSEIGVTGSEGADLSAQCLYNWFQARHSVYHSLYHSVDLTEKLENQFDILKPCIFENGDIPLTFSTPVLKKHRSSSCSSEEEDSSEEKNRNKKKLRTLSLQRLFMSKSFRKKKAPTEYDKKPRRYSETHCDEWGEILQQRHDSPIRSPKRHIVKVPSETKDIVH